MTSNNTNSKDPIDLEKRDLAKKWIAEADSVFYTSGAGLTAAAGVNFSDTELFAREYPAMLQYGFTAQYQFIGYDDWSPDLQWGYWAHHVDLVRFKWPQSEVYTNLRKLSAHLKPEDTFVMTSNVDAMSERNGFDPTRIFTPQGDYALLQCTTPCTQAVWPWKEQIDKITAATNPTTQRLEDLSLVPKCPNCGGTVFPNVRLNQSFIDTHFKPQIDKLNTWLSNKQRGQGVIIEVGAGFNTPSVIRWPGEGLVANSNNWKLIRINLDNADVPAEISERAIGLQGDALEIINSLQNETEM